MQKISRIVNSIYLATELTAGTAKIYDLIAEFFNFGPDTFFNLQSIDMKQLKSGLESIVSMQSSLTSKYIEKKAEQRFLHLDEIRKEVEGVGRLEDIKDAQAEYKSELETFKKTTFDTSGIEEVLNAVKNISGAAENIEKYSHLEELDDGDRSLAQGSIFNLKKFISTLKKVVSKVNDFDNFEKIRNPSELVDSISKIVSGFEKYYSNRSAINRDEDFDKGIQSNAKNLKLLESVASVFQSLGSLVGKLQDVIDVRRTMHLPKYTVGFIDGTFDPKKVVTDLEDDWVQSVTHEMDLNTTINLLLPIGDYVSAIESSFKLSPSKQSKFFTNFKSSEAEVSPVDRKVDDIITASNKVSNCIPYLLSGIENVKEVKQLLQTIDSLKNTVDALVGTKELVNWVKTNDAVLKEVEALCSFTDEEKKDFESSVPIKLKSLNSSENYTSLIKTLNQSPLFADVEFSNKLSNTSQQATDIIGGLQFLDAFYTSVAKPMNFFECFLIVPNYDLIPLAIDTLNKVRKMDVQPIRDGIDVVNDLFNVSSQLEELKTKLRELNDPNFSIGETPLSNPSGHTAAIGMSVRGVIRMKDEIDHGSDFRKVIESAEMVDQEMKKTGKQAINMVEFGTRLKKLKTELEGWKANITVGGPHRIRRSTPSLADYSHIFQNALKVGGVDDDLKKLMDAVEDLENTVTDGATKAKLKSVIASLSSLDSIGLQLSSFVTPFNSIGQSFTALDTFFVSNRKIITTPAPIVSSSDASQGGQKASGGSMTLQPSQTVSVTTTEKPMAESTNLMMFIGIGCGIVLVSALIVAVICFYKRNKKEKGGKDENTNNTVEDGKKVEKERIAWELADQMQKKKIKDLEEKVEDGIKIGEKIEKDAEKKLQDLLDQGKQTTHTKEVEEVPKFHDIRPPTIEDSTAFVNDLYNKLDKFMKECGERGLPKNGKLPLKALYQFCQSVVHLANSAPDNTMEDDKKRWQDMYSDVLCGKDNRILIDEDACNGCYFKDEYINANYLELPNGNRMILTQAPTLPVTPLNTENECKIGAIDDQLDPLLQTVDKFYQTIVQTNTEVVVMFCNNKEEGVKKDSSYFPLEKDDIKRFGKVDVCTKKVEHPSADVVLRTLLITTKFGKKERTHTVKHFCYKGWIERNGPESPREILNIFRAARNSKSVVVHCSDGIGRSAAFVFAELVYQTMIRNLDTTSTVGLEYLSLLTELRHSRPRAIHTPMQLAFSIMMVLDFVMDKESSGLTIIKYKEISKCYHHARQMMHRKSDSFGSNGKPIGVDFMEDNGHRISEKKDEKSKKKSKKDSKKDSKNDSKMDMKTAEEGMKSLQKKTA